MNSKFLKLGLYISSVLMVVAGCVKPNKATFTDFSTTGDIVLLQNAGMANFNRASFNRGSDTVRLTVRVDLASKELPTNPTTVKLGVDNAAITSYNAANPQPGYVVLPAGTYKLLSNTLTIPAASHYAETTLEIYTKSLDPTISYMLPISITDASGKPLSSNANTVLFHTIGNPLAGAYNWNAYRWNGTTDTTKVPSSIPVSNTIVSVSPLGPNDLLFPEYYINTFVDPAAGIDLNFTNNAGVLSNFTGFLADKYQQEITDPAGFAGSIITSSVLVSYQLNGNAANHYAGSHFRFFTAVKNSSGGTRTIIDDFVKQ